MFPAIFRLGDLVVFFAHEGHEMSQRFIGKLNIENGFVGL
tara:strand:- start:350 stop:469 length:120 start_codon:yes stop_codon:yes gene_type:complete